MSLVTRSPALLTGGRGFFSPPSSKPRLTAQNVGHLHRSPRSATGSWVSNSKTPPRKAEAGFLRSVRGGASLPSSPIRAATIS